MEAFYEMGTNKVPAASIQLLLSPVTAFDSTGHYAEVITLGHDKLNNLGRNREDVCGNVIGQEAKFQLAPVLGDL